MPRSLTKEEIFQMSVPERLELIESLWDSISPGDLPVPESHRRALDGALEDYRGDEDGGRTWDAIRDELFDKE